jgi:hypothetical protein
VISRSQTLLVAGALAGPLAASAGTVMAATRVALVRPSPASPAVSEALTRIEGELAADGFEVVLVDPAAEAPAGAASNAAPDESGAQASISFVVDTAARTAELRVVDRLTNKAVVRRTPIDETNASRAAEVLAVRAVELLRASLLELMIEAEPPPAPATPAPATPAHAASTPASTPREADRRQAKAWAAKALPAQPEAAPSRWSVEAGAGVLASAGGVGPAVIGVLRGRFEFANVLAVRATLAGLGTQPRVDASTGAGSANVAQDLGLVEIVLRPWPRAALRPTFSAGAGALYASVDGQASSPYVARQASEWSAVGDVGAGLELPLGDRFALALEVHALVAQPYPVVRFLDDDAARAGDPSILGTLTLAGSP